MVCLSQAPSYVWTCVLQFLFGLFEDDMLIQRRHHIEHMRPLICNLSPVHSNVLESLLMCSFMDVYQTIRNAYRLVSSRIHLSQLSSQQWHPATRQCAVRACSHQTGLWTPVDVGHGIQYVVVGDANYRGSIISEREKARCSDHHSLEEGCSDQHSVEETINCGGDYLVVCSTRCFCYVCSFLSLSHYFNNVTVMRGTHLAHPRMLHRFYRVIQVHAIQQNTLFEAQWMQFNDLIDKLDVPLDSEEGNLDLEKAEYCALYSKWRHAKAMELRSASKFQQLVQRQFNVLKQEDKELEDFRLCKPCPLMWSLE